MKITGYRYETYTMKLDRPIADCNLPEGLDLLPGSVLFIETDEGVEGVSLGFGIEGVSALFHLIEGEDPREVVSLWAKINDYIHKVGNEGAANGALSSIDIALWDLKGKLAEEPLWRTLGAAEGRVKAYASGLDYCLTDDELFQCPFIMMQEVGSLFFSEEDAAKLRTYLLKGGFLWVDDFWGSYAWNIWAAQIRKVLPPGEYPIEDLPKDHPMFHTLFDLPGVPQIPSINYWYDSGGRTSERGFDSAQVHARAISDASGRVMVLMTHNTDVSDSWEREGDDPQYFYQFSVPGYQVAINVLLYTMTH